MPIFDKEKSRVSYIYNALTRIQTETSIKKAAHLEGEQLLTTRIVMYYSAFSSSGNTSNKSATKP